MENKKLSLLLAKLDSSKAAKESGEIICLTDSFNSSLIGGYGGGNSGCTNDGCGCNGYAGTNGGCHNTGCC